MGAPLRRAGSGRTADGSRVTWTVAEGRRGRRWREVVVGPDGSMEHALLFETDPERRFAHLELARGDILATLHVERDHTVHGNSVGGAERRVTHTVGLPFRPGDVVLIGGSVVASAAAAWSLASTMGASAPRTVGVIRIGTAGVHRDEVRIERLGADRWRLGSGEPFTVDADGTPRLDDEASWPLELDD